MIYFYWKKLIFFDWEKKQQEFKEFNYRLECENICFCRILKSYLFKELCIGVYKNGLYFYV